MEWRMDQSFYFLVRTNLSPYVWRSDYSDSWNTQIELHIDYSGTRCCRYLLPFHCIVLVRSVKFLGWESELVSWQWVTLSRNPVTPHVTQFSPAHVPRDVSQLTKQLLLIFEFLIVRPWWRIIVRAGASWRLWRRCKSRTFPPIFSEIIKSESVGAVTLAGSASQSGPGRAPSSHASARGRSSGSLWSRTPSSQSPGARARLARLVPGKTLIIIFMT